MDLRPEAAEAVGVFLMLVVGGMAAGSGGDVLVVALAFGLTVMVLVYALGHVSGAHFNPAITLAFAATRHFPWTRVPSYLASQLVGAVAGVLALRLLGAGDVLLLQPASPLTTVFASEVAATFLLALVIIGVATDRRAAPSASGLAIGSTVLVGILGFGAASGAAMNPARALAPALVAGNLHLAWVYLAAPSVGAVLAMACYEVLRRGRLGISPKPLGASGPFDLEVKA